MSLLGGHKFVFQADREKLLNLIQAYVTISGTPLVPPFRLSRPGLTSPIFGKQPGPVDLIVTSVQLTLDPGTNRGWLHLGLEAGVIRLENAPDTSFTGGELQIAFEFEKGTLLIVKLVEAKLQGVLSNVPNFETRSNAEVNKILDSDRNTTFELFPNLNDTIRTALMFSATPQVIDERTAAVFVGSGEPAQVPRALQGNNSVAFALAADYVRETILCHALLKPEEVDHSWKEGMPPTIIEKEILPAPCGTGALSRGQDGVDVKIKRMDFTFRDGYIDITGRFDAEDTCWKVKDGSFSQKLYLDFNSATRTIMPHLMPLAPTLNYHVTVFFLCYALAYIAGYLTPVIGGVLLGLSALVTIEIAKGLVNPTVPAPPLASASVMQIAGVRWISMQIFPEGLLFQGDIGLHPLFYDYPQTSIRVESKPANVMPGLGGVTIYKAPTCVPQEFAYQDFTQQDVKALHAETVLLIEPVRYQWFVNGTELPIPSGSPLKFTTKVRTAVPPPAGIEIPGYMVELGYDLGQLGRGQQTLTLTPRIADLQYHVYVEMMATDAVGRVQRAFTTVQFTGVWAEFGQDYYDYREECFRKLRAIVDHKTRVKRLRPGEPQQELEWMINYLVEHMEGGSPEVETVISAAVRLHGLEVVNMALEQRAAKMRR